MDVDLELLTTCREGSAGARVTVSAARAKQLIASGGAVPATKAHAKRVGVDEATAATSQRERASG